MTNECFDRVKNALTPAELKITSVWLFVWLGGRWQLYYDVFELVQDAINVAQAQMAQGRAVKLNFDGSED